MIQDLREKIYSCGFTLPNFSKRNLGGFTVIELLVSIGIFSVVMSIAMGGLTQALRSQRQAAAFIAANSNMSLALEQMVREIRVGQELRYATAAECPSDPSGSGLSFKRLRAGSSVEVIYCFDAGNKTITREEGGVSVQPIVADNVSVEGLTFTLLDDPLYPPRVTIVVEVAPKEATVRGNRIFLQTTASVRL